VHVNPTAATVFRIHLLAVSNGYERHTITWLRVDAALSESQHNLNEVAHVNSSRGASHHSAGEAPAEFFLSCVRVPQQKAWAQNDGSYA
jgi:hypothetical protein